MSHTDDPRPDPERLAAYADGELPLAQRREVEAWLARHPEGRAEVEAVRRLARLCKDAAPPEPSEAAWADVLARVEAALPAAAARRPTPRRRIGILPWVGAAAAAAAALFLAVAWWQAAVPGPAGEPLPVVSADDVEILGMDAGDVGALVVGRLPVLGPLVLASAADIIVDDTGHDVDVVIDDVELPGHAAPPMIIMPLEPPRP